MDRAVALPKFGLLEDILCLQERSKDVIFAVSVAETLSYNPQFAAYEVLHQVPSKNFHCFFASSLTCHYLFSCVTIGAHKFVKSKYDLSGYF